MMIMRSRAPPPIYMSLTLLRPYAAPGGQGNPATNCGSRFTLQGVPPQRYDPPSEVRVRTGEGGR